MKQIPDDWILSHWGEEEIPRYLFLDYVGSVYSDMQTGRLFPAWEDSYAKYRFLRQVDEGLGSIDALGSRELIGMDLQRLQLLYSSTTDEEGSGLESLRDRIRFARPILKKACQQSQRIRSELEQEIEFGPMDLHLFNRQEGFLFTLAAKQSEVWSWYYKVGVQSDARYAYSAIKTRFVGKYQISLSNSLHQIRNESIEKCGLKGTVVSSWVVSSKLELPVVSALKPLGIFRLVKELGLK